MCYILLLLFVSAIRVTQDSEYHSHSALKQTVLAILKTNFKNYSHKTRGLTLWYIITLVQNLNNKFGFQKQPFRLIVWQWLDMWFHKAFSDNNNDNLLTEFTLL